MAELVQLRLEYEVPELEEMKRVGLFSLSEIRNIVKRREAFEYKLRRSKKRKEDFLQYIKFEMSLLMLVSKKRERLMIESKKKEIDNAIAQKINRLFKRALSYFPEDEKLWLDQIQYCIKMKWHDSINALYTRMLQVHSRSPELWVMAAKWEIEDNNSPDNARKLLQRAVLMNPKSELIWREYFRMELMYIDFIRKRQEVLQLHKMKDLETDEHDAVLGGSIVNIVYDNAVEEIEDVNFALSFIQIALEFNFASRHVDHILEDVQRRHPDKEETLDALAKRPLLYIEDEIKRGKEMGLKKKVIMHRICQEIYSRYDEAVERITTEKMWSYYLDFIHNYLKSAKEKKRAKVQSILINKVEKAAEANCLSLNYYAVWIDLLFEKGDDDAALSVSLMAARKWNQVSLWIKCLTLHIRSGKSSKKVYLLFSEALSSLNEKDSISLWKLGVEWLSFADPERLIEFFEKGINKCTEISTPLKDMYLEATALRNGTQAARDLYKRFKKMGPLSPQVVRKMIIIEKAQLRPSIDSLRKYYEDGIREFGTSDIDLWLEYMKLEIEYPGGSPSLYGMLYWRAMKTLQSELKKDFQTRVTAYVTGCGISANWELIA